MVLAEKLVFQSSPGGRCTRISLAHQRAPSERSIQNSARLCDEDVVVGEGGAVMNGAHRVKLLKKVRRRSRGLVGLDVVEMVV